MSSSDFQTDHEFRARRLHTGLKKPEPHRSPFQKDLDRILYSSALRRLAGVTQVAGASEGGGFHNRLTHSLKVAQIARRLAERLRNEQGELAGRWGLDADVVEAAALAHDVGHPPFGHVAERQLDQLVKEKEREDKDCKDGFEGNAQSFRQVTKLSAHRTPDRYRGLDLTRATLNALMKYPWFRGERGAKKGKFSAYRSEEEAFDFAREGCPKLKRCLEAEVMDYADDVAYSLHDLEDFYRAGLIPIDRLLHIEPTTSERGEREEGEGSETDEVALPEQLSSFIETWKEVRTEDAELIDSQRHAFHRLLTGLYIEEGYEGSDEHRGQVRTAVSKWIDLFINSPRINEPGSKHALSINEQERIQLKFLQRLVWVYVIENPTLGTQQEGQRRVINNLFDTYFDAAWNSRKDMIHPGFHDDLDRLKLVDGPERDGRCARLAADIIASFRDQEAILMHHRFSGISAGSITDMLP